MADAREDGPKLTLLMGCEGSGRTGWRRANQDLLPEAFFDADSLADALGGWDSRDARERGMELLGREIERAFRERRDVGLKTPGCERTITQLTARAREAGFRVEGTYIGTAAAEINRLSSIRCGSGVRVVGRFRERWGSYGTAGVSTRYAPSALRCDPGG